jgi:type IV secretion system protein VirB5
LTKRNASDSSTENPYLNAKRAWNGHTQGEVSARQMWQVVGILGLLIGLAGVGGMIHIGSQSKFVPMVYEVNKHGEASAVGPLEKASPVDPRVVRATVANFISDARVVTPDVALQRKAVFRVFSMLSIKDPATVFMNEWMNGTAESSPFKRAQKETVSVEIVTVLQQTAETWQIDWMETTRDRQGVTIGQPARMRALVTTYIVAPTSKTTEAQQANNPAGIYVRELSWSKQI